MKPIHEILTRFPESLYPANSNDYIKSIIRGYNACNKKSVLIIGLARDLGKTCPYTISRINRIGSMFRDYRVVILENDSVDNTANRLRREAKRNSRWVVVNRTLNTERHEQTKTINRAMRMAQYRNLLMELSAPYKQEYVIVLDTDLEGGYSYDGIAHTFSLPKWDMIGSNGLTYDFHAGKHRRLFYDSWAFRRLGAISAHKDSDINLLRLDRGEPLMPVKSCFGGLGIYRSDVYFCGAKYGHINELGEPECDHVTLHTELHSMGFKNIYLNPSLITLYAKSPFVL